MKKSLIALAVAGTFAAPAAFAATANVDVYGLVNYSLDIVEAGTATVGDDERDNVTGVDNGSRIGFKGSEDLGGGLKGLWQIETGVQGGALGNRNTFVGLNGGFGTVLLGNHDHPYKMASGHMDPFGDTIGDNAVMGSVTGGAANQASVFDRRMNTVAYVSPTMSGFSVAAAYVQPKQVETNVTDNDLTGTSYSANYANGPLRVIAAYEKHKGVVNGAAPALNSTATLDSDAWKIGASYKFGDLAVNALYEEIDRDGAANAASRDAWYLSAVYAMGPMALKAAYGKADDADSGANTGATLWAVGLDYNLSKRTAAYVMYADLDNESSATYGMGAGGTRYVPTAGLDASGFSIGMRHSF